MNLAHSIMRSAARKPGQRRALKWSGHTWLVRTPRTNNAPGNNAWSDSMRNVSVDSNDIVTLRITNDGGQWNCIEMESPPLGYGTYSFTLHTNPNTYDQKPVLGIFTYDDNDDGSHEYREIDIEFSAWNDPTQTSRGWFTVHYNGTPYQAEHSLSPHTPYTTKFTWQPGQVYFSTYDATGTLLGEHIVYNTVYTPATETIRLNLWLVDGTAPTDGQEVTAQLSNFSFIPNDTYTMPAASAKVMTFTNGQDGMTLKKGSTVSGGNLLVPSPANDYSYSMSGPVFNLQNSSVDTKIIALQPTSGESWWYLKYDNNNYIAMYAGDGTLYTRLRENGTDSQFTSPYNAVDHLYWRIKETGGQFVCQTSPDRSTWTNQHTYSHTFGAKLQNLSLRYECSYWGTDPKPVPMTIAAVNSN